MRPIEQRFAGQTLTHEWFPVNDASAAILMFPTVLGITDLERGFAAEQNGKRRSVLIADVYGARFAPEDRPIAVEKMDALKANRAGLRDLVTAIHDAARNVAEMRIAAIGFCFGGMCALDLARSGAEIAGAASFHGLLDPPGLPPQPIKAKVIAFHGWDDPLADPASVVALGEELTAAGCDWQVHAFGGVGHGFTNPAATGQMPGIEYDAAAARRSWAMFDQFMAEIER